MNPPTPPGSTVPPASAQGGDRVIEPGADRPAVSSARLNTVSLRLRATVAVAAVLGVMMVLLTIGVDIAFGAQSSRELNALLTARVQIARAAARNGAGPMQIVNRTEADGVRAHLVLRTGQSFGTPPDPAAGIQSRTVTLSGTARVDGSTLTVSIDPAVTEGAHRTLRRALLITGLIVLALSIGLVTLAVRLALRPLAAMGTLAQDIAAGHRGGRLAPSRTDTEIGVTARAFDEMLDELEGAEARARDAQARTRTFLADAAHELRTPITGLQAAAETLLHHGSELDPPSRERLESLLITEAQRAGRMVSDLLAAARLDAGVELDRVPTSLGALAHREVERARLLHPAGSISLDGPDISIWADPVKVSAILRNLIDNALRAAGPQGRIAVELATTTEPGQRSMAVAEVSDSGPGVQVGDRERIFERLVRLNAARSADSGGSGLGLAIARGYARAHGGDLRCEDPAWSPSGRPPLPGARFVLRLPIPPPGG